MRASSHPLFARCSHAVRALFVRCSRVVRALFVRCLCERELTRELRDAPVCRAPHTVPTTRISMPSPCCCVPPAGTSKGQASCEGATLPHLVEALALRVTVVVKVGDVSTEPAHRGLRQHLVGSQPARCLRKPPSRATGRRPPLKRDVASLGRHCASQHHRVGLCQ